MNELCRILFIFGVMTVSHRPNRHECEKDSCFTDSRFLDEINEIALNLFSEHH